MPGSTGISHEAKQRLGELAALVSEFTGKLSPESTSEVNWWTDAMARQCQDFLQDLNLLAPDDQAATPSLRELDNRATAIHYRHNAKRRIETIALLAEKCEHFANVEYDFLYDEARHLLAIGYNPADHRRDPSYYDLLASESRLCSFVRSPKGNCPRRAGSRWGGC